MSDYFNNDNRICKVLQILEHKRSASLEYLEKKLNVSTKSIKNDIKELNEIFDGNALIQFKLGKYKLYVLEYKQFEKIKEIYEKIGYKVIETEAKNNVGIETLKEQLKNNINAFSGNSGVGKSTLINAIFNDNMTEEGEISKKNKRGKNTTTSIKLYKIDENTYIADTPGFSTFDISEIKSKELDKHYKEFLEYIKKCEFIGCTHIKEENCGIKNAIEKEQISKERYDRFCKIYNELKEKEEYKKW